MSLLMQAAEEDRLASMARQMSKWVDQILGPKYHKYRPEEAWTPAVNLYEAEDHYCLVVDLPGMSAEKIDLRLESGLLTLSGERLAPAMPDGSRLVRLHVMEIDHGRFSRTVDVPANVDAEKIGALYRGGYLFVRMPKKT